MLIVFTHINLYAIQICGFGNYFNDLTLPTNLFLAHLTQWIIHECNGYLLKTVWMLIVSKILDRTKQWTNGLQSRMQKIC